MKKSRKIATSLDVAKLAGVSQSAVSRCFTKGASISSRTKLRVREAAKKLGYKDHSFFKNNKVEDSGLVGVILPYITNRYYPEVLTELHEALRLKGYRILLITTDDSEELDEQLIQPYLKEKLIAIITATKPTYKFVESCNDQKIQVIAYNRNFKIPTTSSVACDHRTGGEVVAKHFHQNSHKVVGLIEGMKGSFVSDERCRGFKNFIKSNTKIKLLIGKGNFTYEGGYGAASELLQNKYLTAIFCADDTMAFGCVDFIKNKTKLKIPNQIEVIGYDDMQMANWESYNLTTIRQPIRQMSKLTTQLIDDYLQDPDFESANHLIEGKFIKRKSSK
ncbi:LacI family DNA-binding transcriptional regulator [Alphaproteobacteria bacterium]|nr:LacI family DNA-binding transcriptional regulator [Alphaproteobacteria bacterium]